MTGNKSILDTSIVIHSFKSKNNVAEKLDLIEEIFIPVFVLGELMYGAHKSSSPAKHFIQINAFPQNCTLLAADTASAGFYGSIKALLEKKGKPLPENDIWLQL